MPKRLGLLIFFLTIGFNVASALAQVIVNVNGQTPSAIMIGSDGCSGTTCSVPNIDDTFASNVSTGVPAQGTYVGTLSTTLSAGPSPYSGGYTLSASGGSCTETNNAHTHFQIGSGDQIQIGVSAPTAGTTYTLCVQATGDATITQAFAITVHNIQNASTATGCTGSGTSAAPWHYKCIQGAVTAASTGDTVFLPAGDFVLQPGIDAAGTAINAAISVMGAGAGNTLDVYGHINNGSGTTPCPTSLSTVTCIYTRGTSYAYGSNPASGATPSPGTIKVGLDAGGSSCSNNIFAHLAFDTSLVAPGGDDEALLNFEYCPGPITLSDLRFYTFDGKSPTFNGTISGFTLTVLGTPTVVGIISIGEELYVNGTIQNVHIASYGTGTGKAGTYTLACDTIGCTLPPVSTSTPMTTGSNNETEIFSQGSSNLTAQKSFFGIAIVDSSYSQSEAFETVGNSGVTISNSLVWQGFLAPTNDQNYTLSGTVNQVDVNNNLAAGVDYTGPTGCHLDPGSTGAGGCPYANLDGSPHITFKNNRFTTGSLMPNSVGGAVNDPSTNGNVSDFNITGNWVVGTNASIAACTWIDSSVESFCNSIFGPAINASGSAANCTLSQDDSYRFNITNNSIVGSSVAKIDGQGFGTMKCFATGDTSMSFHTVNVNVYGFNAQKNYFSGPNVAGGIAYTTNARTISPTAVSNYCAGGQTFTQTDSTTCATSGFTTLPTVSFSLGNLYYDPVLATNTVPITSPAFTAQYGAVEWLASTSSTTPTSTGQTGTGCNGAACNWAYVPPALLAGVTHGSTVYMWAMDSVNNISSAASALIP